MTQRVELEISDDLYARVQVVAEREYRTVAGQITWVLDNRYRLSPVTLEDVGEAVETLHDELRRLHRSAGLPSSRALATETDISHTTVNDVLRGQRVPPWHTLEKVVKALGGDIDHYQVLWLATQA